MVSIQPFYQPEGLWSESDKSGERLRGRCPLLGKRGSKRKFAIVRKAEKDDCQNIEMWTRVEAMLTTFNMKELDVYGMIVNGGRVFFNGAI